MAEYKITFTPSGAYFFGNEKRFSYNKQKDSPYFIEGEKMPSQSTILGALRYILLPIKKFSELSDAKNVDAVGEQGFNMDGGTIQSFGKIKSVSPIFINRGNELFVQTPFDHNCSNPEKRGEGKEKRKYYTPMKEYKSIKSSNGQTLYLADYDVKYGLADSFMSLEDGHLEEELFETDVRIGIGIKDQENAFFKKAYKCLKKGYSFCVFAKIENSIPDNATETVMLGQGKVPFYVRFEEVNDDKGYNNIINEKIQSAFNLKKVGVDRIYCVSDMLSGPNLYDKMKMAIVQTKDYRSFYTNEKGYARGSTLHRLVKAGSVFIPMDDFETASNIVSEATEIKDNWTNITNEQKNAKQIGYNQFIYIIGE